MNKHLELASDYTYLDSTIITIISAAAAITSAIASIVNLINSKIYKYTYKKHTCTICSQVCYNKKDLDIHMQREHLLHENEKGEKFRARS